MIDITTLVSLYFEQLMKGVEQSIYLISTQELDSIKLLNFALKSSIPDG